MTVKESTTRQQLLEANNVYIKSEAYNCNVLLLILARVVVDFCSVTRCDSPTPATY